jgi:2-polyprenyl-3-methyl-5-hydroxy-6-metoxy-1,4-benzoquinol methylase
MIQTNETKMNNQTSDDLDQIGKIYLEITPEQKVNNSIMKLAAEYTISRLPPGRILEMGVGGQVWTPKLVEQFEDVTTVDGAKGLLDKMSRQLEGKGWTSVCSLFEDYEPEQLFDVVVSSMVLEHVDSPNLVLQRARNWLVPRGYIAVLVPHALSLHRRLAVTMGLSQSPADLGASDLRLGHRRCMTHLEVEALLEENDFEIIEGRGLYTKLLPNEVLANCTEAQLRGMFQLGLDLPVEYGAILFYLARRR